MNTLLKLIVVVACFSFNSPAQSLRGNLYNHWSFSNSVAGLNGQSFMFDSPAYSAGKFGVGLHLTSNGPVASAIGSGTWFIDDSDWTVMFWMKLNTLPASDAIVLDNVNASSGFSIWIDSHGTLTFYLMGYSYYAYDVHVSNLTTNTDYLVLFGYNYVTHKSFIRVNDSQVDAALAFTASYAPVKSITIGGGNPYSACKFDAVVSLLTIWSGKALASWEMQALWNGGNGLKYPF